MFISLQYNKKSHEVKDLILFVALYLVCTTIYLFILIFYLLSICLFLFNIIKVPYEVKDLFFCGFIPSIHSQQMSVDKIKGSHAGANSVAHLE